MVLWILIAGVLYALFDFFVAKGSVHSDAFAANGIFNGIGALLPLLVFVVLRARHTQGHTSKYGVIMDVIAGVLIAVFSVILVKLFARGGNLAYVLPAIYGLVVVFGALLGHFVLKEQVSMLQMAGIVVTALGVGMIVLAKA